MNINDYCESLINQNCISVIGGSGAGSVASLGFGKRIKRVKPLNNTILSETDRLFKSEYRLLVFCAWRFMQGEKVVCGWRDAGDPAVWEVLRTLIGRTVKHVFVNPITYDLRIEFHGECVFELFCDITSSAELDENYLFFDSETSGAIEACSIVSEGEQRSSQIKIVSS